MSHTARSAPRGSARTWLRRAALLGCIVFSLALVGDQAAARSWAPAPAPGVGGHPGPSVMGLALLAVNTAHRSVGAWSDGSFEALSLLALGLGLFGAGQVLGRKPRFGSDGVREASVLEPAADGILRPHRPRLRSVGGRSAP